MHSHDHGQPHDDRSDKVRALKTDVQHQHAHRHIAVGPRDPFLAYTGRSSFAIGMLHGIGAETPTQVLLFLSAANATGRGSSIGLLLSFVAGLMLANTVVASASTFGFQRVLRYRFVTFALAGVTAAFSLFVGVRLIIGS